MHLFQNSQDLPVIEIAKQFCDAIETFPVVIVSAPPGSGKTTMIPIFLRDLLSEGEIWVIEPRRIAAVMAAHHVARQLGQCVGDDVGYNIRFASIGKPHTRIRFMTDGVFLRRLLKRKNLSGVAAVCLDEFHERSMAIDLGALWFRNKLNSRQECPRLVILSATLAKDKLLNYFPEAGWIEAPGKSYSVTVQWAEDQESRPLNDRVAAAIQDAVNTTSGSILCFLPTVRAIDDAIRSTAHLLQARGIKSLPLHGGLSIDDQEEAIRRSNRQRVIFATNIAESSLTVEGVSCVIDSGLARMLRSDNRGGSRLVVDRISQSSCIQRAGRAGREGPGTVIRLFSSFDFSLRPIAEPPEVITKEAIEVVMWRLALISSRCKDTFLLDEPQPETLQRALWLLQLWGVLSDHDSLSQLGFDILALPVDPRVAIFLVWALERGGKESAIWAACILATDPRERQNQRHENTKLISANEKSSRNYHDKNSFFKEISDQIDRCDLCSAVSNRDHLTDLSYLFSQLRSSLPVRLQGKLEPQYPINPGELLSRAAIVAFPDRVAVRRLETDEYFLANGERGVLSKKSNARGSRIIVAIDLSTQEPRAGQNGIVITTATPIEEEWLFDIYPQLLSSKKSYEWDESVQRVNTVSSSFFGEAIIERIQRASLEGDSHAAELLSTELKKRGLLWIISEETLSPLLGRLEIATSSGAPWEGITINEEDLLLALCRYPHRKVSHKQLSEWALTEGLNIALTQKLGDQSLSLLSKWCPEIVSLPKRPRATITYKKGHSPFVASRIQDFFGIKDLPKIAGGSLSIGIHLLDPRGRTIQVTNNLSHFWSHHYPTLKRQLQSRYPKHNWPQDPLVG